MECILFPLVSILSRSKDTIGLESSSLASDENAEKEHTEYSRELEMLCEGLQTTLDALVRCRDPRVSRLHKRLAAFHVVGRAFLHQAFVFPSSTSSVGLSRSTCPINLVSQNAVLDLGSFSPACCQGNFTHSQAPQEVCQALGTLQSLSPLLSDSTEASGCSCVPIKLYLWMLNFAFQIIFMCHKIFCF